MERLLIYVQREVKGRWRTRDGLKDQKGTTVIARQTSSPHTFPYSLDFVNSLIPFDMRHQLLQKWSVQGKEIAQRPTHLLNSNPILTKR